MKFDRGHLIWVGIALLAGWGWLTYHDSQVRQIARLQTSSDSLDKALHSLQERSKAREARDTALADSVRFWRLRAQKTVTQTDTLVLKIPTLDSALAQRLPDSLKAAVLAVTAPRDSIIAGLREVVGDLQRTVGAQTEQLNLRGTSLAECQAGLAQALVQRDAYRSALHPSLFTKMFRELPYVAGGLVLGVVLHR